MVMYSFIQFVTNLIAYWRQTMMADLQFLFIDLIIVDMFALTATRLVLNRADEKVRWDQIKSCPVTVNEVHSM